jgi:3',5'-cyclic AMP phosphodiesterase CpdA
MPRDAYLSFVQAALERRLEEIRLTSSGGGGTGRGGPEAADGSSIQLGDQLFDQFGPDDFGWITTVVEDAITKLDGGKRAFGMTPAEHRLAGRARLVLLADWGTGTPRAKRIAELAGQWLDQERAIERHLIHLGDVYYCGLSAEYQARFLGDWPALGRGGVWSWNLNGNHDMYSGGQGYFDVISSGSFAQQQGTSCFRLFNEYWQFVALDTAYADNDLYDAQLPWLARWVEPIEAAGQTGTAASSAPRTVLLSHHQLGSARAQDSVGPGIRDKTAPVRDAGRIHAWFWGHEHRAFIYEPYLGVACPVCLGNGGVPELLSAQLTLVSAFGWIRARLSELIARSKHRVAAPVVQYQPATPDVDSDGLAWEKLGFVVVDIDGATGSATYVDEDGHATAITGFGVDAPAVADD